MHDQTQDHIEIQAFQIPLGCPPLGNTASCVSFQQEPLNTKFIKAVPESYISGYLENMFLIIWSEWIFSVGNR